MRFLLLWLLPVFVAGCATAPLATSYPPPDAIVGSEGAKVEGGVAAVDNARVARAYLTANEVYAPFQDNLPFGLILLRAGDGARNTAVCNSFVNNLQAPIDIIQADPEANIILTYWLLKKPLAGSDLLDCKALLANYDFSRSAKIRSSYGRANAKGPIFLGLQLNEGLTDDNGQPLKPYVALLDLSAQSPTLVAQATINWFDMVVTPGEDAVAAGPAYQPEKAKGRGLFKRILAMAEKYGGQLACAVLRRDAPAANVAYTEITAIDPVLNKAVGTVRLFVRSTGVVGLGAELIGDLLCKPGGAAIT